VDSQWGADRAIAMLDGLTRWLAAPASAGFRNHFVIRDLEALGLIAGRADLANSAASILRALPDSAFTAGVITNISDLSPLVRREVATLAAAETCFPAYTDQVRATIAGRAAAHTAVFGEPPELESARAKAYSALDLEEFASACAVAGHLEHALHTLDSADFEPNRRIGPRMVVCVEAFRADRLELAEQLILEHFSTPGHFPLSVAAGLLGRVPWAGYPFPDY
jgi:hypothetical protein